MPELTTGMRRSGRDRRHFEIMGGGYIATGPDDAAVAKAIDEIRYRIAFYGSTKAYWPVFELHGLHDLGEKLRRMVAASQWDRIAAEVPDEVVHLFAAVGRYDEIVRRVEERFGGAVDTLYTGLLPTMDKDLPADLIQDIRRVPHVFDSYRAPTVAPAGANP